MTTAEPASNDYHFITRWRVHGDIAQVADIIGDARGLTRWWPSVYLEVNQVTSGDESGVGKVVDLYTKGWLPYTLRWSFHVTESRIPHRYVLVASGDFEDQGIWTFEQDGPWTLVTYDWKIRAAKPLLRYGSFFIKPIFAANHRWAMARGEESLRLELARRQGTSPEELARIPPPPAATTVRGREVISMGALVAIALYLVVSGWRTGVRRLKAKEETLGRPG